VVRSEVGKCFNFWVSGLGVWLSGGVGGGKCIFIFGFLDYWPTES
jgi:hypothetical protein